MKKLTAFCFMSLLILGITSCSDDDNSDNNNTQTTHQSFFVGQVKVEDNVQDSVLFILTFKDSNLVDLVMNSLSFSPRMPKMNISLNGISYEASLNNEDTTIIGDSIIPIAQGISFEMYTIRNLNGVISKDSLNMTTQMGSYNLIFKGKRQ